MRSYYRSLEDYPSVCGAIPNEYRDCFQKIILEFSEIEVVSLADIFLAGVQAGIAQVRSTLEG